MKWLLLGRIAVLRRCGILLQTEYTRGLSALSVTIVSHAKTAEPVEMPFRLWTRVGPRNWESTSACEREVHCKVAYRDSLCRELCKTAEPIKMPFGMWTLVVARKYY